MAPHLKPEVVAAIETAVECNEGSLESAFIHSLAKIYKTSPQAIVWNMKRYNKVKAGCDDRRKTGRHAVMDKEAAADYTKELLLETPGMHFDKISEKLLQRFDVHVSTTWVSRLIKRHGIAYKVANEPSHKKDRSPKQRRPRPPPVSVSGDGPNATITPQYPLPSPGDYPSFRQDLEQAIAAPRAPPIPSTAATAPQPLSTSVEIPPSTQSVSPPTQYIPNPAQPPSNATLTPTPPALRAPSSSTTTVPLLPPATTLRLPPPSSFYLPPYAAPPVPYTVTDTSPQGHPSGAFFGILKPSKSQPSAEPPARKFQHQYKFHLDFQPSNLRSKDTTTTAEKPGDAVWKVLNVVELG